MKKVRTEKVMANVNDYLKRRNLEYARTKRLGCRTETNKVQRTTLTHMANFFGRIFMSVTSGGTITEQQAGVLGLVSPSTPNSFTFSTTSTHHSHIDHQYVRLKSWMMEASEPCRSELSQVLFPLFIHLYLELVAGTGRQVAKKFFIKHYQVFLVNRDYENTLSQVLSAANISTSGDMNSSPIIQNLKSGKYLVRLSELTLEYFLRYLKATENPILLQIFNTYIEVEVDDSGAGSSGAVFRSPETNSTSSNALVNGHTPESMSSDTAAATADGMDCSQEELQKVKDVMALIKIAQPSSPSVCVYTVSNAYNGLSCASVNAEGRLLSCGFEDSVIKLWKLTPPVHNVGFRKTSTLVGPRGGISHTLLACDNSRIEDDGDGTEEEEREEEEAAAAAAAEARNGGRRRNRGGELFALRGHSGPVLDTTFTHDSTHLLSVSEDTTMRLWNLESGQAVALYRGHNYPVWCVAVGPLTMYVATGSYDNTARIWSTDCTYPLRTLAGHTQAVDCVAFHPNGTYLATGSCDRTIRLWQVTDGDAARIFLHHKAAINSLSFSPNGKYLASGSDDGAVAVWDLAGGRVLTELCAGGQTGSGNTEVSPHLDSMVGLCWSTDSSVLVSASSDGCVRTGHLRQTSVSDGGSAWELNELCQVQCSGSTNGGMVSNGGGGQLLHTSLTCHNYLTAVTTLDVER
ncbi:TAF5-like RNA polymerase II p300/CBP-associated factor-associated factor 65 kDa subunit 5L isoform X2 [Homarus americanus]|uniref:TAF5-like RNA polymerase II p300/CBP-associated factor-associated factor 65 kDa subunit 5L isoform X2 n=1 Tax=Homarus americanus TaxID=6706 RepID=UPI001C47E79F|nr:TAF5-like RNA polymerase II p300/CBP-associated factor-associated factor 65 kDa subunit 5L isoform X2 [Homarus americanus]